MIEIKKLTIGMIIKNESKNLERCLNAITPVLNEIDSELVIVDTGSLDNSKEIAKEYTDKVYDYKWINDFAAARNESLKYASGEWFMYMDADEFLDDSAELIRFFKSGEYKRYDAASYILRNYVNPGSEDIYEDAIELRMFKTGKERKFVEKIHEHIATDNIRDVKMLLKSVFKHWGYCIEQDKEKYKNKLINYERLIREKISSEPEGTLNYISLSDIYSGYSGVYKKQSRKYLVKAAECVWEGILAEKNRTECRQIYLCVLYKAAAKYIYLLDDYKKLDNLCSAYFSGKEKGHIGVIGSDLDMYFYSGIAHSHLFDFKTAAKELEKYISFYRDIQNGKYATNELLSADNAAGKKSYFYTALKELLAALAHLDNEKDINKHILKFAAPEDRNDERLLRSRIDTEFEIMSILGSSKRYKDMINRYLGGGKEVSEYFILKTEAFLEKSPDRECLFNTIAECGKFDLMYQSLNKLRISYINGENLDLNCLECFFDSVEYLKPIYGDALYFSIKYGVSFDDIAAVFNSDITADYLKCTTVELSDFEEALYARIDEDLSESDVSACLAFMKLCREFSLARGVSNERRLKFFERYSCLCFEYTALILSTDNIDKNSAYALPENVREMYLSGAAYEGLLNGSYDAVSEYLRGISVFRPEFKVLEKLFYGLFVKANIRRFIEIKQIQSAKTLLEQYKKVYGSDEEISELENLFTALK